jgi:hypothetical protein
MLIMALSLGRVIPEECDGYRTFVMRAYRLGDPKAKAGRPKEIGFSDNPISEVPSLAQQRIDKNLAKQVVLMLHADPGFGY